ncbi:uncharacterized protein [Blastocystis hominis]|uniref:RWD domain-containing protein n=1 Tax=Blastocystis hominis TaxID=12968 RepID=D8M4L5_BLAHO|nr:uncharacterized protein [Blastocystis hominis]CBK23004.2 unnamed protein product [Blastocystis hominis]|eukprot:XP_012897052.1 uncharacterized protein [Blastocystis hominis]
MISSEQEEELESLPFIYSEEELIVLSKDPVHIQIRVSSTMKNGGSPLKALLDLNWGENYPNEKPEMSIISIDIKADEKEYLLNQLIEVCEQYMGMAMTFILSSTLTQLLTDHHENWLNRLQSATSAENVMEDAGASTPKEEDRKGTKPEKPQQKTKAQKKHEENNWTRPGELPRGYNWVDVVNHLRKT